MPCTLGQQDFRLEEDASASPGLAGQASRLLACRGRDQILASVSVPLPEHAPKPATGT